MTVLVDQGALPMEVIKCDKNHILDSRPYQGAPKDDWSGWDFEPPERHFTNAIPPNIFVIFQFWRMSMIGEGKETRSNQAASTPPFPKQNPPFGDGELKMSFSGRCIRSIGCLGKPEKILKKHKGSALENSVICLFP